jgi:hypothetical protein
MRALIGLQDCDNRIREMETKKGEAPVKMQRLEQDLNTLLGQIDGTLSQLDDHKREARQIEHDIEDMEGRIEKSNQKLSQIKSNKEYRAALKEIEDLNREKSLREDKAIQLMEDVEVLEKSCTESKAKKAEAEREFEKARKEIEKELHDLEVKLDELGMERRQFCDAIDPDLLERYNFLRQRKGGIAISPVIKGVCQTCHLGIPPQKFNELIRGEELMSCPNCMRIIYWGEDDRLLDKAGEERQAL